MGILKEISMPNNLAQTQDCAPGGCYKAKDKSHRPDRRRKTTSKRKQRMLNEENHHDNSLTSLHCGCYDHDVMNGNISKGCNENDLLRHDYIPYRSDSDETNCYYDTNMAQKCHKLLNQHSNKCTSSRIMLFPEEEWARNAPGIQWSIKMNRWWKRYCTVTELRAGGRHTISAVGKIVQNRDGTLTILGRFKRNKDPDFRLHLSARVTKDDFEHGYLMTGALQLGDLKGEGCMEITHFAVIPRHQSSS